MLTADDRNMANAMIRHIVFFSIADKERIEEARTALLELARIPAAERFEVGRNLDSDRFSTGVDLIVYGEFRDIDALEAFRHHPIYEQTIAVVRPLRDMRIAADFESEGT